MYKISDGARPQIRGILGKRQIYAEERKSNERKLELLSGTETGDPYY